MYITTSFKLNAKTKRPIIEIYYNSIFYNIMQALIQTFQHLLVSGPSEF